jgi:hypothetical protein
MFHLTSKVFVTIRYFITIAIFREVKPRYPVGVTDGVSVFCWTVKKSNRVKGKGKFVPVLNKFKNYIMKAYGGVDAHIHIFLIWALAGGEWATSRLGRCTPGERAPGTHWIGDWVDPRAGVDNVEKII